MSSNGRMESAGMWTLLLALACVGSLIVIPFAGSTRTGAKKTACLSNLKHIGVATAMYIEDEDGRLPLANVWIDATQPYTQSPAVYSCPSVPFGYALSSEAAGQKTAKWSDAAKPSTMLYFETDVLGRGVTQYPGTLSRPGRHKGRSNVCYLDFHVKAF